MRLFEAKSEGLLPAARLLAVTDKNNRSSLRVGGTKGLVGVWCGKLSLWAFPSVAVADVMSLSAGVSWGYHCLVTY